jgi:hypothetical protein
VKRALILDLKLVQAFTMVSLARNPITSFIFWIRSLDMLQAFALTLYSETPLFEPVLHLSWAGLLSCLGISSYLSTSFDTIFSSALFILINFSNFFSDS